MTVHSYRDAGVLRISVIGRFDFKSHQEFRKAYHPTVGDVGHVVVDLSGTDYVDSSALGMLLVLRKEAVKSGATVELAGASDTVGRILEIAKFGDLFRMASAR